MAIVLGIIGVLLFQVIMSRPVFSVAGDDPGVTITGPEKINSSGLVALKVTLGASAGKLTEKGTVHVVIPKRYR